MNSFNFNKSGTFKIMQVEWNQEAICYLRFSKRIVDQEHETAKVIELGCTTGKDRYRCRWALSVYVTVTKDAADVPGGAPAAGGGPQRAPLCRTPQ
ncbi:hypothetical protein EVAR_64303_1 [Eumeta japonica]|uniref:Uncharacterized protein n=1 Tax=Eumeta variegata TaxID=151549 RepID=A0A4C1ZTH1_EUMVA|nr:hypothetical protein EVAR_64303_1 [Eumeta japonica]